MLVAESFIERNTTSITVVVAVVLALAGIWFSWFLYQRGQTLRTFDHRVVSDLAILSGHERPDYIKVMSGPFELTDPRMTTIKFKNTGRQAIDESDFRAPYLITRKNAKLLDYSVIEETSPGLVKKLEREGTGIDDVNHKLLVHPGMLNRGKEFTLKLLYDGGEDELPVITGEFFNQSRESGVIPEGWELWNASVPRYLGLATGAMLLFMGIPNYLKNNPDYPELRSAGLLFIVFGLIALISGFALTAYRKRKLYARKQSKKPEAIDSSI